MTRLNRREWFRASGAVAVSAVITSRGRAAAPRAKIEPPRIISWQPELYHGWPTLARRRNGQLLLAYSGGRESHVCPFGRVELMQSHDGGRTWLWPRVLMDSAIDDRDAGVVETAKGSILVTTFTSLAYESLLQRAEKDPAAFGKDSWPRPPQRLERWRAAHQRLTADERKSQLGVWMLRSTDGGATWSAPYRSLVNSPHGPIQLSDGRLLYAGKALWETSPDAHQARVGVCESLDDGVTWRWVAPVPARPGDTTDQYHELHAVEAADGRLIVQIRNHNKANAGETLQSESSDGGKTWSVPREIGVWGLPSHLLRLNDGRLLMTYGHRRKPLGNQARVSRDHGRTWSEPILLSDDGVSSDLGYPSTAQLDDGTLVTVWYEVVKEFPRAVLRQTRWTLEG